MISAMIPTWKLMRNWLVHVIGHGNASNLKCTMQQFGYDQYHDENNTTTRDENNNASSSTER